LKTKIGYPKRGRGWPAKLVADINWVVAQAFREVASKKEYGVEIFLCSERA